MNVSVTRILEFDAGHRVHGHESKCATLHGHRYKVEVEAEAPRGFDSLGRIIDFSVLKERLGGWLDKNWDHTCLIWIGDHEVINALIRLPQYKPVWEAPWNPTAENMARHLLWVVCPELFRDTEIRVMRVTVWETPNCRAEARL